MIELDREQALVTMSNLHDWDDADDVIEMVTAELEGIDSADIINISRCGGWRLNVARLEEYWYRVSDDVWEEAGSPDGVWCISCLEDRLGRQLGHDDFDWAGSVMRVEASRSDRLRERMQAS